MNRNEFTAKDWFTITGRGLVVAIENPDGINPRLLLGQVVLIDGEEYLVRGVETHSVPDWSVGKHPFGLLVRKVKISSDEEGQDQGQDRAPGALQDQAPPS